MEITQSFNRYETKFLLTPQQYEAFTAAASGIIIPDSYGLHTICNIYLDTDDFYFIEHSLDKPSYKEKLRLRSYGNTADGGSPVFWEIKKKYGGVVYKRRISIPLSEAEDYIYSGVMPSSLGGFTDIQIYREIDHLMKKYAPSPKLYLAYDRVACFSERFPEVRVTFDRNIRSRTEDLTLCSDADTQLLDVGMDDYVLMELKTCQAVPLELAAILSRLGLYPISFSKYGRIYTDMRAEARQYMSVN